MLQADVFSHTGSGGSMPWDRVTAQGYKWNAVGENIAWRGTSAASIDLNAMAAVQHKDLFLSSGHRVNLLSDSFREIGLAQEAGDFTSAGTVWRASMLTEVFARSGTNHFLTGVVYTDSDKDGFYSIGEGTGGAAFAIGTSHTQTAVAGGYALGVAPGAAIAVSGNVAGVAFTATLDMSLGNVKLDVVGGTVLETSGDIRLGTGIESVRLLGVAALSAEGTGAANHLAGNPGANSLLGQGGNDTLAGGAGADSLLGGDGKDRLLGASGADLLRGGRGGDVIQGNAGFDRMDGEAGNDVLIGGAGGDRFVFRLGGGADVVTDFSIAEGDMLVLDQRLWGGGLTEAMVLAQFADVVDAQVLLDFGTASIRLDGLTSLTGLAAHIDLM